MAIAVEGYDDLAEVTARNGRVLPDAGAADVPRGRLDGGQHRRLESRNRRR